MKFHFRVTLFLILLCTLCSACGSSRQTTSAVTTPSSGGTTVKKSIPSTTVRLTGLVKNPGVLTLANLQSFPKVTTSVNVPPIGAHTFAGALLYAVLQSSGYHAK